MSTLTGLDIGRYHIIEQLGEGGMATVYKAFDNRLERQVAIKFIRRDVVSPQQLQQMLKRFEREAKSLARLSHPNIVKVHDYGEYEDMPYLVMEYLEGGSLKDRTGKSLPYGEAVRLLLPIARALEYAHNEKIIHRDVKPANILLSRTGEPHLSDFGVAKILEVQPSTILTGTGVGVGTPEYMAPEQWVGKVVPQTDQYALGVVLFELVTGRRPYTADTPAAVLLKQATEPLPRPKDFVPDLPDEVERVLFKVLNKAPEERYADMSAFGAALESLKELRKAESVEKVDRLQPEQVPAPEPQPTPVAVGAKTQKADEFRTLATSQTPLPTVLRPHPLPPLHPVERGFGGEVRKTFTWLWVLIGVVVISVLLVVGGLLNNAFKPPQPKPRVSSKDGMVMVYMPAGEFMMGSDNGDADEKPQHTVSLDAYWIDQTEVTNSMYAKCVTDGECELPTATQSSTRSNYYDDTQYADYPVINVDWSQANAYCGWAGRQLPTEAEWEKAARSTDGRTYPWGEGIDCSLANYRGKNSENDFCIGDTQVVGSYPQGASMYGALDLAGNVWEWVADWYSETYYIGAPSENPQGLASGQYRVLRGGSLYDVSRDLRSSDRSWSIPGYRSGNVGFRCAR
jgi:formylglycine-generating enzyme required for sulfatase activity/tRNA A-37 threonylcarbamoyl transferase component Bud32